MPGSNSAAVQFRDDFMQEYVRVKQEIGKVRGALGEPKRDNGDMDTPF